MTNNNGDLESKTENNGELRETKTGYEIMQEAEQIQREFEKGMRNPDGTLKANYKEPNQGSYGGKTMKGGKKAYNGNSGRRIVWKETGHI